MLWYGRRIPTILLLASDSLSVARIGESSEGRYWVYWLDQRRERLEHDNRHERAEPGKLGSVAPSERGVDIVDVALHVGCDRPRWRLAMNCFNFILRMSPPLLSFLGIQITLFMHDAPSRELAVVRVHDKKTHWNDLHKNPSERKLGPP